MVNENDAETEMKRSIRWGVVGAGNVCERKAGPPLYSVPGSEMTLLHRRDRAAGEDFVQRHGNGRYVETFEELVHSTEIDAVYIATPHAMHAEQTIAALQAGKHVLVEKPMALSTAECDAMVDAARENGRSLGVAYYRRGYPSVRRVRDLLRAGAIGRIQWGSLNNEFPTSHRLDLVHHLLGDIRSVRRLPGRDDPFAFEAIAPRFDVETVSGANVRMITPWSESGMPEALHLEGTAGKIHLSDLKGGFLLIEDDRGNVHEETGTLPFTHWGLIENFTAHLLEGRDLLCDGEAGRKSTVILDALAEAVEDEEWVAVDYRR